MALVEPVPLAKTKLRSGLLLTLGLFIGISAFALVGVQVEGKLPENFAQISGTYIVFAIVFMVVINRLAPHADPVLLPIIITLNGVGLAMIYRIDLAERAKSVDIDLASKQLIWTIIGMLAAMVVLIALRDHRTLRRYSYTAMVLGLVLIILPMVPGIGKTLNGARIWINFAGFSLQPAELAKICFAIFFAGYLVTSRDTLTLAGPKFFGLQLPRFRDLGPIMIVWVVSLAVLILEKDLGTSLLLFGLFIAMLYIATERFSWVLIGLVLFSGGAVLAAQAFPHVMARFDVWLHAMDNDVFQQHPGGSGQIVRGLFGMANGGLLGTGFGNGRPDLVPYASSDFIVTSFGEELGLTGLMAILLLLLIYVQRGMRIAIGTTDGFGKLLTGGLAFVMAWQCFVVVGGVTRIIPLTGLTTPFLAYGGSSLLSNWIILALLLRVSNSARAPQPLTMRPKTSTPLNDNAPIIVSPQSSQSDFNSDLRTSSLAVVEQHTEVIFTEPQERQ